jgi:hypothetical protein
MTAAATARRETSPTTNYRQAKRFSRRMPTPRKPLYQAVFRHYAAKRRAETAAPDCIKDGLFIDPPYNTGNDFVYRDNFTVDKNEYDKEAGVYDEDDDRLFLNTETNGRFHSDWCSMIYLRPVLARNLLRDNGRVKHIYFIAETKGSMSSMQLRMVEESKKNIAHESISKLLAPTQLFTIS